MRTPRVLFVGRTRYRLPLNESLSRKWDALSDQLDLRVLAAGTGDDPRFHLVSPKPLDGPLFYATLPVRVARELRSFHPDVVMCESPYEAAAVEVGRALVRSQAKVIVEIHGDWHTSTRLYGSRARALLGPVGDRIADTAVRRADAQRAVSAFTASLVRGVGREPTDVFTAYTDLSAFTAPAVPVPAEPRALFVGVLERYKNIEGLAAAWRLVAERLPDAQLQLVGSGRDSEIARGLVGERVRWDERLEPAQVAQALDDARVFLLASESEGLPRVVVEAFLRGRPVVATRAGGTPEIVVDDVTGLLVDRGDVAGFADAAVRALSEPGLAERLGAAGRESVDRFLTTPGDFANRMRALIDEVIAL
ncbi:MAG TPA: glycosyltransferase family 4 protein [Gaiellaceae bacterium]|nr:glycosyltransferase family 4 protein [Gaiellaceae bacterium]